MTPDELRQELTQAGFQDVRFLDSSYLVSAKTKQGHDVVMVINLPDTMNPGTMTSGMGGSGNAATGSSSGMPSSMSGGHSGSSSGSGMGGQNR